MHPARTSPTLIVSSLIAALSLLTACDSSDEQTEDSATPGGGTGGASGSAGAGATANPAGAPGAGGEAATTPQTYDHTDNLPASNLPPAGLAVEQVPMFVSIGFDDNGYSGAETATNDGGVQWAIDLLAARTNPAGTGNAATYDGTPITMSFYMATNYISTSPSDATDLVKEAWRTLYEMGNEIGSHTHSHPHGAAFTADQWRAEIEQSIDWLTRPYDPADPDSGIGIPRSEIYGFRTPFLEYGDALFAVLTELGFWYDCSIEEGFQYEQNGTNFNWPFTLDSGSASHDILVEWGLKEPINPAPGLWEMPAHAVFPPPDALCEQYGVEVGLRDRLQAIQDWYEPPDGKITGFDYNLWSTGAEGAFEMTKAEVLATLKYTLDLRLQGNRAPMMFGAHTDVYTDLYGGVPNATYTERQEAIEEFIDYALAQPDVRVVSNQQILDWMRDPQPLQ